MKTKCFTSVLSLGFRRLPFHEVVPGNRVVSSAVKGVFFSLLLLAGTAIFTAVVSQTTFGPQQIIIEPEAKGVTEVYAADLDNDGDMDVLSALGYRTSEGNIAWYENDGSGNFGQQQVITLDAGGGAESVFAADLDSDGGMDALSASWNFNTSEGKIAWYKNDGSGNFGPQQTIALAAYFAHSVFAADLDNDGDMDVLSASTDYTTIDSKIAWYENDGNGNFGSQQIITTAVEHILTGFAADLDNDGDVDLLSASNGYNTFDSKIVWHENDGNGNFAAEQVITLDAFGSQVVYAADLNNDGNLDVVSASHDTNFVSKIVWYENEGNGSFGAQQVVLSSVETISLTPLQVHAADLDNDGDQDLLSASFEAFGGIEKVAWYENEGNGNFGTQQILVDPVCCLFGPPFVVTADLENDGDLDVLWSSGFDNKIAWFENEGSGDFGTENIITAISDDAYDVYAADLDNDGDQDVLSASGGGVNVAWYKNNGSGNFGPQQAITTDAGTIYDVFAADLDNDGDQDVLSASYYDNKIV